MYRFAKVGAGTGCDEAVQAPIPVSECSQSELREGGGVCVRGKQGVCSSIIQKFEQEYSGSSSSVCLWHPATCFSDIALGWVILDGFFFREFADQKFWGSSE